MTQESWKRVLSWLGRMSRCIDLRQRVGCECGQTWDADWEKIPIKIWLRDERMRQVIVTLYSFKLTCAILKVSIYHAQTSACALNRVSPSHYYVIEWSKVCRRAFSTKSIKLKT